MKRHARSLEALFRVVLATVASAATYGAMVSGCGGRTEDACAVVSDAGSTACSYFEVKLSAESTPALCGFPAEGLSRFGGDCERFCGKPAGWTSGSVSCSYNVSTNSISCNYSCTVDGRRPPGLVADAGHAASLGEWFAHMAHNEAAAIDAFAILGTELAAHGAPLSLRASVARARRDEVRHARSAARLAQRYGGKARKPRVDPPNARTLLAMALENAREGCARETMGALIGTYQAEHASTPELRRFYAGVARDETRHASLSWRMHAWFLSQLPAEDRGLVQEVLDGSLASLEIEATEPLRTALGLPGDGQLHAMRTALAAA